MKKILFILPVILILGIIACNQQKTSSSEQAKEVIVTAVAEIDVEGMTCTGCENSINKSVQKLEGVAEVSSSHVDKKTIVKYDPEKTTVEEIKQAITSTGYQVVEPIDTE